MTTDKLETVGRQPYRGGKHDVLAGIRRLVRLHGALDIDVTGLADTDDLFRAGLNSHSAITLMLAVEEEFDMEFPEPMLNRTNFRSIAAIARAVEEVKRKWLP